ncbi:hypothetical protein JCM18918_2470 [Cutibacterium acnes JCM 18918]|nr:hypothetical protein JCM18918_2470 [Cutibacterium acnes JCM 18918]
MPSSSVSYRTLFSLPGGTFVAVSALARLPLAMSQLGTLLLVSSPQVSGRLGPGGLAAGVVALAIAIGSPFFWCSDGPSRSACRAACAVSGRWHSPDR